MNKNIYALIDCDSFFASCEQVLNPKIKGFPVCVLSNNMGCVIARSHEAKEMGIEMCMPYVSAKKRFPGAIYLKGEIEKYQEFSNKIMKILQDFSPNVEVYSIDEAFVDLTGTRKLYKKNYYKIAQDMRERIKSEVGIDVSIGLSTTKTLAKLASGRAKKEPYLKKIPRKGIYIIGKSKIKKELQKTKIEAIWGIGNNSKKLLNSYGIVSALDFVKKETTWIKQNLGKNGIDTRNELLGIASSPINCTTKRPKSIQITRSFLKPSEDKDFIKSELKKHLRSACSKLRREGGKAKSVVVMLKTKDFTIFTQKEIFESGFDFELDILDFILNAFNKIYQNGILYRSCGVTFDTLSFENQSQLGLFEQSNQKSANLAKSIDKIKQRYGKNSIKVGF